MAKKRKRKKTSRTTSKMITRKIMVSCSFILLILLVMFGVKCFLFNDNLFRIGIDNTTDNITFNDLFDSDTIRINRLRKLSDKNGKKIKALDLNISGVNDGLEYEIILIPINVSVDNSHIKYYLTDEFDNDIKFDYLSNTSLSNDYAGNVIYSGVLKNKNDKFKLRVWIDDGYDKDINSNLFEVKIKLK